MLLQTQKTLSKILNAIKSRYIEIFKDQVNRFYLTLRINDHIECVPLESSRFKNVIRKEYYDREKNTLSDDRLDGIIKLIESELQCNDDLKKIDLNLRVAKIDD